jgi:hypothetical protein
LLLLLCRLLLLHWLPLLPLLLLAHHVLQGRELRPCHLICGSIQDVTQNTRLPCCRCWRWRRRLLLLLLVLLSLLLLSLLLLSLLLLPLLVVVMQAHPASSCSGWLGAQWAPPLLHGLVQLVQESCTPWRWAHDVEPHHGQGQEGRAHATWWLHMVQRQLPQVGQGGQLPQRQAAHAVAVHLRGAQLQLGQAGQSGE